MQEICTLGPAWEDEFKKPRSLGEGTGAKASDNSEAPQKGYRFKARLYHPSDLVFGTHNFLVSNVTKQLAFGEIGWQHTLRQIGSARLLFLAHDGVCFRPILNCARWSERRFSSTASDEINSRRIAGKLGEAPCGPPLLESLDVGVSKQQRVTGYLSLDCPVQHEAEDLLDLRLPAPFDVAQHRCRILRILL